MGHLLGDWSSLRFRQPRKGFIPFLRKGLRLTGRPDKDGQRSIKNLQRLLASQSNERSGNLLASIPPALP